MIQLGILFLLAILLAYYVSKNKIDNLLLIVAKLVPVISSPLWLGVGFIGMLGVYLFIQAVYIPAKNYFSGKDIWFIDNESWFGKLVTKYLGNIGGRIVYIGQAILALLITLL